MKLIKYLQQPLFKSIVSNDTVNGVSSVSRNSFIDYLLNRGHYDLASWILQGYYSMCAPLSDAIERITQEIQIIKPRIKNTVTDVFLKTHPILDLLDEPNGIDLDYNSFIEQFVSYYILDGTVYLIAIGAIDNQPLELFVQPASTIGLMQNSKDGYIDQIQVTEQFGINYYNRIRDGVKFRYINTNRQQEIGQLKRFNPNTYKRKLEGQSTLQPIYFEIEQYLSASRHNLSLLERGASPSGIISTSNELVNLTESQRAALKEEINNYWGSSRNTGRIMLLDRGFTFQQVGQTMKDMDFRNLKNDVRAAIYNKLGIPLPMVNAETMTMSNRESSVIDFYDNAVLPLTRNIFKYLTKFLMPRFSPSRNLEITFDEMEIGALEPRRNQQMKLKSQTYIYTPNELRKEVRLPDIEAGDELYVPVNLAPIGDVATGEFGQQAMQNQE